jgi:Virulence factor membrane-bound polymerase, C-terminal/O-Antigen ligase
MRSIFLLAGLAGLFLSWNLPNHYPLWTTFHGELIAAVGVCLLFLGTMWSEVSLARRAIGSVSASQAACNPLSLPTGSRIWLLVAAVPPLQYLFGLLDFYGDALLGFLYAAGVALSVYVGCLWAAQTSRAQVLQALFLTMLWAGLAAGGIAFWQWVRLPTPGWWAMDLIESRPYGNFAQPNLFGLFMVMGIVAATSLFETRVLRNRASYWLVVIFFGMAMLISESRAAWVAALAVAGCWFLTCRRAPTRLRWFELLALVLLGVAVRYSLATIEDSLYLKANAARAVMDVGVREPIWRQFWAAVQVRPWMGYGFDQGAAALREVSGHMPPARNATFAHNLVLDLMTWVGMPLGITLATALTGWLMGWLRGADDPQYVAQRHWVFAIWLALGVHSLLEFPFTHTFFLLPAAVLAGAITLPSGGSLRSDPRLASCASRPALAVAVLAMALLVMTAWDYLQFEAEFRANRFDKGRVGRPAEHDPHLGPVVLDHLAALNAGAHIEARPGMPPNEIALLGRVARRFHLLPSRYEYAKALALNGRMADAQAELDMIRGIYAPVLWEQIERQWLTWQQEHQDEIRSGPR